MGLRPEDIEGRDFPSALRGFDRAEVRSFLREVAETLRQLEQECQHLRRDQLAVAELSPAGPGGAAVVAPSTGADLEQGPAQAARLLEEARAQSELICQEAEELARVRVRTTTEQAERRLSMLRTTEQASRARILAAQQELAEALRRLDDEPDPRLQADAADEIVVEAARSALEVRSRLASGEPSLVEAAPVPALPAADLPPPPAPPRATAVASPPPASAFVARPPAAARPTATGPRRITPPAAAGDDALAALVREAMQRAVESARPGRGV